MERGGRGRLLIFVSGSLKDGLGLCMVGVGVGVGGGISSLGFEFDEELFCVRPFTWRSSATDKKELSSSCATLTSPWYMKLRTACRSPNSTPFR